MDFDFNDEQREIKSTAHDFIASRFKPEKVRELAESEQPVRRRDLEPDLRARLAGDRDLRGVRRPGPRRGRAGDPAGGVRLRVRSVAVRRQRLRRRGDRGRGLGRAEGDAGSRDRLGRGPRRGGARPRRRADRRRRRGLRRSSCSPTGTGAKLVETGDADARAARPDRHHPGLLPGRRPTAASRCRATSIGPSSIGQVALAAELVGVAQRALEMAVDYAKERQQFDRPIGAYQAVSHRLAEMLWDVEEARSLTYYAAWCADARAGVAAAGGLDGEGARLRQRHVGDPQRDPDLRRHRLHLGARHPLLPQARPGRRPAAWAPPRQHRERVAELVGL